MDAEYLLYKLISSDEFANTFLQTMNIKDINWKKIDKLKTELNGTAEICNFMGGLSYLDLKFYQIQDHISGFDSTIKYLKKYNILKEEICIIESTLIYLLVSGKLNVREAKKRGFKTEYLNELLSKYRIYISPQGELVKSDNSWLFLEFMLSNGFKPENSDNILELVQSVPSSLSQYLKAYKQFLLSDSVKYSDLKTYDIKGAYGYVEESEGIVVPKTIIADEYFREKQGKVVDKQIPRYTHTNINEFDTVIAFSDDILNKKDLRQILTGLSFGFINRCFGFIAAKDDRMLLEKQDVFKYVLDELNKASNKQYTLVHDTDSCKNKELYLIRNK